MVQKKYFSLLLVLFFFSGATSLAYQVIWVRQLSLVLGSTLTAISIVISAFMGGLALGSFVLGGKIDEWGKPFRTYALLEGGIALSAIALHHIFVTLSGAGYDPTSTVGSIASSNWLPFLISFILMLIPTTLMGGTLPVLSRFVGETTLPRGSSIGILYAVNTCGAIVGAMAVGFFFIRHLGLQSTVYLSAAINGIIFTVSLFMSRFQSTPVHSDVQRNNETKDFLGSEYRIILPVTIVYIVNGLAGLALEVLWTRSIVLFVNNSIYAFTIILTTFLFGITLGSSLMSLVVQKIRRPAELLGTFQSAMALAAAATPLGMAWFGIDLLQGPVSETAQSEFLAPIGKTYLISVVFMLPATLFMGASFPLVARIVTGKTDRVGRAVGRIYALNTMGAIAGSLLAGFLLIPLLGLERSITWIALLAALTGLYLLARLQMKRWTTAGAAGIVIIVAGLLMTPGHYQSLLAKSLNASLTFYEEGREATVAVFNSENARRPVLVINNTILGDKGNVHKLLAHLPLMIHPDPQRVLVLGFGTGITSNSVASHDIPVNDCVEISPSVIKAAPLFASLNNNIVDRQDPSFNLHIGDGRRFLLSASKPYDVIALDANSGKLRNAGVGKLYSLDFFRLCRKRLSENGIVTMYLSLNTSPADFKMIVRTFHEVFPFTTLWMDRVNYETTILMGTSSPLQIDVQKYLARITKPKVQADLKQLGLDEPGAILSSFVAGSEVLTVLANESQVNSDNMPLLEFYPLNNDPFAKNDWIVSENAFPLIKHSIFPYLIFPKEKYQFNELISYIKSEDKLFNLVIEALRNLADGNNDKASWLLSQAAIIHPEAKQFEGFYQDSCIDDFEDAINLFRSGRLSEKAIPLFKKKLGILLSQHDFYHALVLLNKLIVSGMSNPVPEKLMGPILEELDDPAGAYLRYKQSLSVYPDNEKLALGLERMKVFLGMKLDIFTRAGWDLELQHEPLASLFLDSSVPVSEIPLQDFQKAAAWLKLFNLYYAENRYYDAYCMARAARILEPENADVYLKIGDSVQFLEGGKELAIEAYNKYISLGGTNEKAQQALLLLK